MLPPDLRQAEAQLGEALTIALKSNGSGRWTIELRFEGLRLLPLGMRLAQALKGEGMALRVLCPDAGATALARRDHPGLAALISSLGDHHRLQQEAPESQESGAHPLLLVVGPGPSDYELVEGVCTSHPGPVVLFNPSLEDGAVGIGSVARARRKGFLAQWQVAYALQPFANGALRRAYPGEWELYRLDPEGFRLAGAFPQKPSSEEQAETLAGESPGGLKQQLRGLGDLIDNLQR
ncbi:MAG: DUF1995 family protein [Cyanobacteriota bacterium]|nr:DUF1995 family protein [Cyanobacteriota bacterium]